jgi:hypothetical protein
VRKPLLCIYFLDELFGFSDLAARKGVLACAACALQSFDRSSQAFAENETRFPRPSAHQMGPWRKKGAMACEIILNDKPKPSYSDL